MSKNPFAETLQVAWIGLACVIGIALAAIVVQAQRVVARDRAPGDAQASFVSSTSFHTTTISIPTFPYAPFLILRHDGPYDYRQLDWGRYGNTAPVPQDYTLLVMENAYLRVTLLPELGGRVYQMIFKPTNHNEFYQNPVIQPTHWGPKNQQWWLAAGGLEWCLPVDEHGYEWGEPWMWSAVTSTAGVTVTMRDSLASNRLRAAIDVFLPNDRAHLIVMPHLENPTGANLGFKYWTNAMLAPGGTNTVTADLRFILNAGQMSVHATPDVNRFPCASPSPTGPTCRFPWPIHESHDYSRLGDWHDWLGFFEYPQAAGDFVGVYDTALDEGVARVFPPETARGVKVFGLGWSKPIPPETWTDDKSTYVELHGGVAPTFWDTAVLAPGATLAWKEYWYPVIGIGVFADATAEAALAVRQESGSLSIGAHSTAARAAGASALYVWEKATCAPVARVDFPAIDPAHPFTTSVSAGGRALNQLTIVYADNAGNLLAGHDLTRCLAPHPRIELQSWVETTSFTVAWARPGDWWAGVATTQVQFRDGYEGTWTDWLTTQSISATFSGAHGHTYFFRARSLWGNPADWTDEEWGQAFTTVLTESAPVLVASRKLVNGRGVDSRASWFLAGEAFSYTLLISNTGNFYATAIVTDPIPAETILLTKTLASDSGLPPSLAGDAIVWSGAVSAGQSVRLTYALSPTAEIQLGERVTNAMQIAGSILGPLERQAAAWPAFACWLPVILK